MKKRVKVILSVLLVLFIVGMTSRESIKAEELWEENSVRVELDYCDYDSFSFSLPRNGYIELLTTYSTVQVGFNKDDENDNYDISTDEVTRLNLEKGGYTLYLFDGFGPALFANGYEIISYKIYVQEKETESTELTNEEEVEENYFECDGFGYYIIDEKKCGIYYYSKYKRKIVIPSELDGYIVSEIDDQAFYGDDYIQQVKIPKSVEIIGEEAFEDCSNLKTVYIEADSKLKKIGKEAFAECGKLSSFDFPASLKIIENRAFFHCSNLEKVLFQNNCIITKIGTSSFQNCRKLKKIKLLSKDIPSIGKNAFSGINKSASFYIKEKNADKLKKKLKNKTGYVRSMKIQIEKGKYE